MILTRKLALGVAGVVAAGVLGTAGVAAATSEPGAPTPAASSAPSSSAPATPAKTKKHRAAIARGMHGEWVVKGKDGKPVTLVTIRGQVTAAGPAGVTVKADDGFTATFTTTADTTVRGADAKSMADVKVGAKAVVIGAKNGNASTARTVLVRR